MIGTFTTLKLAQITRSLDVTCRAAFDNEHIENIAKAIFDGESISPVGVVREGDIYWLWDGFHRAFAYETAGVDDVPAYVTEGTKKNAQWFACGANKYNGGGDIKNPRTPIKGTGRSSISESDIEALVSTHLTKIGVAHERQVRCSAGIIDILAEDYIYEIKLELNRHSLFGACGQLHAYGHATDGERDLVIVGQPAGEQSLYEAIEKSGIQVQEWKV